MTSTLASAQDVVVKGRVVNAETNLPVDNVSVSVVGNANRGAITDAKGLFTIKVSKDAKLSVKSVNYTTEVVSVNGRTEINISLKPAFAEPDEVVVVGYLSQKRKETSVTLSRVEPKNAAEGGYSSFQQLLGGRAAGVNVMENNSEPGGGISIEVRGVGSISLSTQPLYVIDGVPIEPPNTSLNSSTNISSFFGNNLTANPLSMLNPNDIDNIEILKDAAATALYGSRGANGVVVITTKAGKIGKPKINFNFNQSANQPQKRIEMLNSRDYATLANEAWRYRKLIGVITTNDTPFLQREIDSLQTYDHQKLLAGGPITQDVSVSISGGSGGSVGIGGAAVGSTKYYVSGQYFNQQGVVPNTYLKRYAVKINYESQLTTKLSLNTNLSVTATDRFGSPTQTLVNRAISWAPNSPLINPDGGFNRISTFQYGYGNGLLVDNTWGNVYFNPRFQNSIINVLNNNNAPGQQGGNNPLLFTSNRGVRNANTSIQVLGTVNLSYKINNQFNLSAKMSANQFYSLLETYIPTTLVLTFGNNRGEASAGNSQNSSLLYQLNLNYSKKIGNTHEIRGVFVTSAEKFIQKTQVVSSQGFVNDITGYNNIGAGSVPGTPVSTYAGNQLVSSILQLNYTYKSKLIFNLANRYDGSSKFVDDKKYGFFPSASVAWKLEKEKWFKPLKGIVSESKIRTSWGIVGNQAVPAYSTLATLISNYMVFGNSTASIGFVPARLPNPNLQWESTNSLNAGIDISFLSKSKLSVSVDAYTKRTERLYLNAKVPLTAGRPTMFDNIATIRNQGLEVAVNARLLDNKKWKLNFHGNIAFNTNKVIKLRFEDPNDFYTDGAIGTGGYITRIQPGKPLGEFYGYKAIGVWNDTSILNKVNTFQLNAKEGDRRYADLNNDGLLNDNDRTWLGSSIPKYFGGFNFMLSYKSFELNTFFSYAVGHKIFNYFEISWGNLNGNNNVMKSTFDQRYRYIFPDTDPALAEAYRKHNATTRVSVAGTTLEQREATDYYIEKGDYIRCRDISLSYRLPAKFAKRLKAESIRFYGNVQNLFIITNYRGFNPEVGAGSGGGFLRGVDNGSAPLNKSIRFGFNVNL